jgi:hypothetical protein
MPALLGARVLTIIFLVAVVEAHREAKVGVEVAVEAEGVSSLQQLMGDIRQGWPKSLQPRARGLLAE